MTIIQTIIQGNPSLVEEAVKRYLIREDCPHHYGLPKFNCGTVYDPEQCKKCWDRALDDRREEDV